MLISKKEILKSSPPFLLRSATGEWILVSKVTKRGSDLMLEVVDRINEDFVTRYIILNEEPFSVGADIWELEYGSVLITLNHESLHDHPAQTLWKKWLSYKNKE